MKQMWLIGSLSHSLKNETILWFNRQSKTHDHNQMKTVNPERNLSIRPTDAIRDFVSCDFAVQIWPNSLLNRLLSFQEGAFSTFEEFAALINSPIDYCSSQSSPVFLHQNYYPILSSAHCRSHYEKSCYQRSHHAQLNSVAWKYSCRRCRISSLFRKPA